MSSRQWNNAEKVLIMWVLDYISTRTQTRNDKFYMDLVDEIALGPDSPRARSGELQNGLMLMKALVEKDNKTKE
jgi:hypothetical protein